MQAVHTATAILTEAAIPARVIGDDVAIFVSPDVVLVGSRSERNCFRLINLLEHTCSCPGFIYRGTCRHLIVAAMAEAIERAEARPMQPKVLGRIITDIEQLEPPSRTVWGGLIWCLDCGCAKAEIGTRCRSCHDTYWAGNAR